MILLTFGPEMVRSGSGYVWHRRLWVDDELFLDHGAFEHMAGALGYCGENFGVGNYCVMYVRK